MNLETFMGRAEQPAIARDVEPESTLFHRRAVSLKTFGGMAVTDSGHQRFPVLGHGGWWKEHLLRLATRHRSWLLI